VTEGFRTIGVDIGGTNIKIAAVWNDGRVVSSRVLSTHVADGPETACSRILHCVLDLTRSESIPVQEMRAIGMDCAGLVDPERGVVIDSPNLRSWEQYPLAARLAEAVGVPVFLENDVNAMAYGEWRCGAGRGARHLVCMTLGTGVGGGLVLDGRLYRGARGAAAEIGHMTIDHRGPRCTCPNVGCLERHLGAAYIAERTRERLAHDPRTSTLRDVTAEDLSPEMLSAAADAGDALAADVLEETGELLGHGLVSLLNVFNPERVVIGGGVARAGEWLLAPARRIVARHAMSVQRDCAEIVLAELGNDAAVVGAALLALERQEARS